MDLELRKLFLKLLRMKGRMEVHILAEGLTKRMATKMILDRLRKAGFKGKIIIDNQTYEL